MTTKRANFSALIVLFWAALGAAFWVVLAVCCGNVWASSAGCEYPKPGVEKNGSGIGGTGAIAKGSGIGGTGVRPDKGEILLRVAGNVMASSGTVEASQNGKKRRLAKGDSVCVGETLLVAGTGSARIRMADDGMIEVRNHSRIRIDTFDYDRTSKKSLIVVLDGTSRFVTGKIGKDYPQNVLVKTPTAVIGVHGTDHETTVILSGAGGDDPAGTYDKVNFGVTFIRTEHGEIDVYPEQVGFSAVDGEPPVLLHQLPEFLHTDQLIRGEGDLGDKQVNHAVEGVEHHDHAGNMPSILEGHDHGAIPELPELEGHFDLPEPPEMPELPEKPEVPEVPEMHDE
jgi:hypothetical protein